MMQVIDEAYVGEIASMPDGVARLTRWIHELIDGRDTAEAIAKCCVAQIQPLKARAQSLLEANTQLTFDKRDLRIELQAQIDAAHAELDEYRRKPAHDLFHVTATATAAASAMAFATATDSGVDNSGVLIVDSDFLEIEGSGDEALQLFAWLAERKDLDLAYKYDLEPNWIPKHLMKPGPIPEEGWCVHQERGGRNDREWDMISLEATPIDALRAAHKAFCDGR